MRSLAIELGTLESINNTVTHKTVALAEKTLSTASKVHHFSQPLFSHYLDASGKVFILRR